MARTWRHRFILPYSPHPNPARLGNVPKDEPPECVDGEAHIARPSPTLPKRKIRPAKTTNRPRRNVWPFILPSLFQPRLPFPRRLAFRAPRRARSHAGHDLREQNQCRRTTRRTPSTSQILCSRTAATSSRARQLHEQNRVAGASIQSWIRVGRRANSRSESILAAPIIRRGTRAPDIVFPLPGATPSVFGESYCP